MNPLISSCLTTTSLCGASSDCTWPCSVKVRRSGALVHPVMMSATQSDAVAGNTTEQARISSSVNDLDRHLRLQLSRMEGELLSRGSRGGEDAAVLCGAVFHRRDQLHVLPDAEREDR